MDEGLFYIQENIPGAWENERYSLVINPTNENNQGAITVTNKELAPNTGYQFIYFVVKNEYDYHLRIVDATSQAMITKDYKIIIDSLRKQLSLSADGLTWNFTKAV